MQTTKEFINRLFPNRITNVNDEFNEFKVRKLNSGYVIQVGCQSVALESKEDVKKAFEIYLDSDSRELYNIWYGYDEMQTSSPLVDNGGLSVGN